MIRKLLSLFLCLITVLFIHNPAMAIEKNQTMIDSYKPELSSYINISEKSEPIYLARERRTNDRVGEMSWAWIGSIFITGLGQILLGEVLRGSVFLAVSIIGLTILGFRLSTYDQKGFWMPVYAALIQIISAVDAYFVAKYQAEHQEEARLLNEKLAEIEKSLDKLSIENNRLNYSLVSF